MAARAPFFGLATAALVVALAGCGDDESPQPQLDPEPTEESSASEPTDATATTTEAAEPFDAKGDELHRGRVKADDADERAVAEAWFEYWQTRITAYHKADVDAEVLGAVAEGEAVREVIDYVAQLQSDGDHVVGDTLVGISDIEVRGELAAVKSCFEGQGHLAGTPPYDDNSIKEIVGTLAKVGDRWVVQTQLGSEKKCRP